MTGVYFSRTVTCVVLKAEGYSTSSAPMKPVVSEFQDVVMTKALLTAILTALKEKVMRIDPIK